MRSVLVALAACAAVSTAHAEPGKIDAPVRRPMAVPKIEVFSGAARVPAKLPLPAKTGVVGDFSRAVPPEVRQQLRVSVADALKTSPDLVKEPQEARSLTTAGARVMLGPAQLATTGVAMTLTHASVVSSEQIAFFSRSAQPGSVYIIVQAAESGGGAYTFLCGISGNTRPQAFDVAVMTQIGGQTLQETRRVPVIAAGLQPNMGLVAIPVIAGGGSVGIQITMTSPAAENLTLHGCEVARLQ